MLKNILHLLLIFILCVSCSEKKKEKHKDLIYFSTEFIAEMGEETYDKYDAELDSKFTPKYLDDIIYVSKLISANACGKYVGDIEIKKDSLILIYKLDSDEVCTSSSVEKVTYIIKNPKKKKYKFGLKYD